MIARLPGASALLSLILATVGISDPGIQADVKAVLGAAAGLVVAVYQWQHHKTARNADTAAATIAVAKVSAAAPLPDPAPAAAVPTAPQVATPGPQVPPAAPGTV